MRTTSATYHTSIGYLRIEHCGGILTHLELLGAESTPDMGERDELSDEIARQIEEYLAGKREHFEVAYDTPHATPFQRRVYAALLEIPYGECRSYKALAERLGNPNASRAVGAACHSNPLHLIIPCHRVIAANGALTGYAAGVEIKGRLLDIEGQNSPE